jgi:hypothetical protein
MHQPTQWTRRRRSNFCDQLWSYAMVAVIISSAYTVILNA